MNNRILIINPFGIGDCLFTTPLLKAIKENNPQAKIGYWCNERVKDIFKNNPRVDIVFPLSRGDLKKIFHRSFLNGIKAFFSLLKALNKEHFDTVIDFSLDQRYGLITKLLGIKQRIGFNYKNRGIFLTHKIDIDGYADKHVVEHYSGLLKFLNLFPKDKSLEIFIPDDYKKIAESILEKAEVKKEDVIVGIAAGAGASWGQNAIFKHWPAIKYAELADKIVSEYPRAKILILGDNAEVPIVDIIISAMKNKPVNLAGKLSLMEFLAIISRLDLLVTNDGGPLHIAVAAGIKTVSIFGPVDSRIYGPYPQSEKHIVVKNDLVCAPCYKKFRMSVCRHNKECINSISVEDVFKTIRRQL